MRGSEMDEEEEAETYDDFNCEWYFRGRSRACSRVPVVVALKF